VDGAGTRTMLVVPELSSVTDPLSANGFKQKGWRRLHYTSAVGQCPRFDRAF
jgi:hypothetical protein